MFLFARSIQSASRGLEAFFSLRGLPFGRLTRVLRSSIASRLGFPHAGQSSLALAGFGVCKLEPFVSVSKGLPSDMNAKRKMTGYLW